MVYLVRMINGYRSYYFKFDDIQSASDFCLKMKRSFVGYMSDISNDTGLKVSVEVLEKCEYEEIIKEEE